MWVLEGRRREGAVESVFTLHMQARRKTEIRNCRSGNRVEFMVTFIYLHVNPLNVSPFHLFCVLICVLDFSCGRDVHQSH